MLKRKVLCISLLALSSNAALAVEKPPLSLGSPYAAINPEQNVTTIFPDTISKPIVEERPDIYFQANQIENNQELQTITASGDVNIVRDNMTLKADKVIYNQKEDIIVAVGNVVLMDRNGNVVFSDYIELRDRMSEGEMKNIKMILSDKSRVSANRARKLSDNRKIMYHATYSPCDVCTPTSDPLWQLRASKVTHDANAKDLHYQNARLEVKGVPIFYTPYLSHPDPSVKRRSGFLAPTLYSNSYLGAALQPRYFINISEHEDFTFTPIISSERGIVWGGNYRKYFTNGELDAEGTFLDDTDNDQRRGHLYMKGRYEVNDFWVASSDINYASSGAYLKDLSLPKKDDAWLVSDAKLQGFDNRNFASVEAYYYKLVSSDIQRLDKPYVVPVITYENVGEVQPYGAYTKNTLDFASIFREEETKSQRATMINAWILPYTSPYGEKYRLQASLKSDLYYVENYLNHNNDTFDGATGRMLPQVGLEWKLPFVRAGEKTRQILEPTIVAVAAPNGGNKETKIPNEDSLYQELDDTNVLSLNRHSGYDRNDTGSRVSYGLNWSAYGEKTGRVSAFVAQTYNVKAEENFQHDKEDNFSDYVGRIYAAPHEYLDFNYRFRLDKESYELNYSEFSLQAGPPILNTHIAYIYLQEDANAAIQGYDERKELYTALGSQLTRDWSINIYNRQDLTTDGGSLEYGGYLTYEDECLKLITNLRRNNSNDPDYEGGFEINFTFVLKTLGGFGSK